MNNGIYLRIEVLGPIIDTSQQLNDLIQFLLDAGPEDSIKRTPGNPDHQDTGSAVELSLKHWSPVALGTAVTRWVTMRPHAQVKITQVDKTRGGSSLVYEGSVLALTERTINEAFEA